MGKSQGDGAVMGMGLPKVFMDGKGLSEDLFFLVVDGDCGLSSVGGSTASVFFTFSANVCTENSEETIPADNPTS